jgi:DNA-binding NarL/FixJ family response regulator
MRETSTMTRKIRIVVADDHPIVRKGLCETVQAESDIEVVAEAGDGEAALALIQKLHPDVAILDLDMPKLDGFAVARETRRLDLALQIIFLTIHSEVDVLQRAWTWAAMATSSRKAR